ncbi:Aclacinomycin-N/aclacinomycin-A oxidase [Xenorhabdus beddingii]|uniref:Aclacinomycin-N/aclacinomycin-A oxidase n=1 Tax=Xenorhabdus beddingii TaxID=40578 RepID=A0A1Y2SL82_9GAMM|nr:BBE domain-containing protein [Xenorhabdus beddingii]OTA19273.1 Aclacinomycin-N/aclacinomycin-A oxidase [Xenorhabdus beddingii]
MAITYISNSDARYNTLKKGFNLRWPDKNNDVSGVFICNHEHEVIIAARKAADEGKRITVRSGGHCYEGFVSNNNFNKNKTLQKTVIIDVGLMTGIEYEKDQTITSEYDKDQMKYRFKIAAGNQNWESYVRLYKISGKTLPGGSCYSVGLGGHITGGGYGLLSRKQGLTVDWLSGIDIIVPDYNNFFKTIHVSRYSQDTHHRKLFKACCGAGGGNFGIILNYYFEDLPDAPSSAGFIKLTYPWENIPNPSALKKFLDAYFAWFKENDQYWDDKDESKCNGGLFALLKMHHKNKGNIELTIQYTGKNGDYKKGVNDAPLLDFINTMNQASNNRICTYKSMELSSIHGLSTPQVDRVLLDDFCEADSQQIDPPVTTMDWLHLTQSINGSGDNQYGKYKSVYQKGDISDDTVSHIYQCLTEPLHHIVSPNALIQINSYGGFINQADKNNETSVYQRDSLLKWQFQIYWKDPKDADACIQWIRLLYSGCFRHYGNKPYEEYNHIQTPFQGCYINYPDIDMKYTDDSHNTIDPRWMELYYGKELSKELIEVKKRFDRNNIFRHEMSIPVE